MVALQRMLTRATRSAYVVIIYIRFGLDRMGKAVAITRSLQLLLVFAGQNANAADLSTTRFTLDNSTVVVIREGAFIANRANIRCGTEDYCLINDYPAFGFPFGLPKTVLISIDVSYKKWRNSLDVRGMFDAWRGRPLKVDDAVRYFGGSCNGNWCVYRGLFSDGEGTFVAEWQTVGNQAFRTVISSDPAVIEQFRKNMDGSINIP